MVGRRIAGACALVLTILAGPILGPIPGGATPASAAPAVAEPSAAPNLAALDHERTCANPEPYHAACYAELLEDVATPLAAPNAAPAGLSPQDLRSAYSLPTDGGAGATVAVVAASDLPTAESDLATYREQFGLGPCTTASGCFRKVDQRGGQTFPAPDPGWGPEIALDTQMVSAACPRCKILLVEADSAALSDLGAAVNTAVRLGAGYVSNSYGAASRLDFSPFDAFYNHPGVVITAASGDSGFGTQYPSSSSYVTAVGGTTLTRAAGTSRGWNETAWSGAGSGCSYYGTKPEWQNDSGCSTRTVADVSAVADPNTGVAGYTATPSSTGQVGWMVFGGTSVAAPLIAGMYALAGPPETGTYPSSYPYQNADQLNDITSGSNGTCAPAYLCTARVGLDGPTGLGTPNGVGAFASSPQATPISEPVVGAGDLNADGRPDLVARKPDGTLWFYAGGGASSADAGFEGMQIATGWSDYNAIIGAGDVNGDGRADLLARKFDGTLWLYPGTGVINATSSGLASPVRIGTGWQIFTEIIAAGDVNGDQKPDLLGRKADGTLWLYAGTGLASASNSGYRPGVRVGTGWNIFDQVVGIGDLDRDGNDDLLGMRPDGSLWYYRGTGASGYFAGMRLSAPGLGTTDMLIAPGDANADGYPDLLARTPDGVLQFFAGSAVPHVAYRPGQRVGSGWNIFSTVVATGDINGDSRPDLLGIRPDGTLWFYAGRGSAGGVNRSYLAGTRIGHGWNVFTKVLDGGDVNGDGNRDLLGVRSDGSLWLYPGTGVVLPTGGAYGNGIRVGSSEWGAFSQIVPGDFTVDGRVDLLTTRSDGSLWVHPSIQPTSTSAPWFAEPIRVDAEGWTDYNLLVGTGDATGDGKADLVARKVDGTFWLFAGTGTMDGTRPGYFPPVRVGTGWNIFASVMSSGDTNAGRSADLIALKPNGALWFYPGVGSSGAALGAAVQVGSGWNVYG